MARGHKKNLELGTKKVMARPVAPMELAGFESTPKAEAETLEDIVFIGTSIGQELDDVDLSELVEEYEELK